MKKIALIIVLLPALVWSQHIRQANWQQQVNYKIDVALDTQVHVLRGNIIIEYINNSPFTLDSIYMHLWPNAYANTQTAYAKQLLENGKTAFLYADEADRGYIDSLNFSVNQKEAKWHLTSDIDVAVIQLNQPLASGQRIFIETPFKVKLPAIFSRSGYENGIYCITQWYPKPAVFDVNGWNPMPYLEQGEFYSEFGNYEVNITVPTPMVVAATGNLQNEEELAWWQDISKKHPNPNPTKTLRFIQNNVHDFAWFASRSFLVSYGHVDLPSGRQVKTWLFDVNPDSLERRAGVNYINNAIRYYSHYLGEYPYDQATVVITPLKAGGGMEYPTITNCVMINEEVIVHEVGHNWFYGILASNERNHPWMDESLNTYYENRMRHEAGSLPEYNRILQFLRTQDKAAGFNDLFNPFEFAELQYQLSAAQNNDQCGHLHSTEYTDANYGHIIYAKNPKLFFYLQSYLGDSVFDNMMRAYYSQWNFRHPLPGDFIQHVNDYSGKNLDWFWNELFTTTRKQQLTLAGVKQKNGIYEVKVKSNLSAPFPVSTLKNDHVITTQWFMPGEKITLPASDADAIRIDAQGATLDFCRSDNTYRLGKVFPKLNPIAFRPIYDLHSPNENRINYLPIVGANLYNKTMLGVAFYNTNIPRQPLEYIWTPMYAFGTRDLAGYANVQYTRLLPQEKLFDKITVGVNWQRFAFNGFYTVPDIDFSGNPYDRFVYGGKVYEKIDPYVMLRLSKKNKRSPIDRLVRLNYNMVNEQQHTPALFNNFGNHRAFFNARFEEVNSRVLDPYRFAIRYEWGQLDAPFQKLSANGQYTFCYNKPDKGLTLRGAGGVFLQKPGNNTFGYEYWRLGNNIGLFDYQFNQALFGRSEVNGLFAHQLLTGDAQFHIIDYTLSTDSWFASTNIQTTLPGVIPVRLYADVGAINNRTLLTIATAVGQTTTLQYNTELLYTGGVCLYLFNGIFQVHVPMFASQQITDFWDRNGVKFQERINFTLQLDELNLYRFIQNLKL